MKSNQFSSFPPEIISNYLIQKELGQGAFGTVYRAKQIKTNYIFALKVINLQKLIQKQKDPEIKQMKIKLLNTEVQNMFKCNSDYILKCYDVQQNDKYKVFVLEYCNQGSLYDKLDKEEKLSDQQATRLLAHLVKGFAELHHNRIIHRDLKSQNILIHNNTYKIADLGLSKKVDNLMKGERGSLVGSKFTMAPEILSEQEYTFEADIWSLAVVYFEALTGRIPFVNINEESVSKVNSQIQKLQIGSQAKKLLTSLFVIDPKKRLKWTQLYRMYNSRTMIFKDYKNSRIQPRQSRNGTQQLSQSKIRSHSPLLQQPSFRYDQSTVDSNTIVKTLIDKMQVNLVKAKTLQRIFIEPVVFSSPKNRNKNLSSLDQYNFLIWLQIKHILQQTSQFFDVGEGRPGKYSKEALKDSRVESYNTYLSQVNQKVQNLIGQKVVNSNEKLLVFISEPNGILEYLRNKCKVIYRTNQELTRFIEGKDCQSLINAKSMKEVDRFRQV